MSRTISTMVRLFENISAVDAPNPIELSDADGKNPRFTLVMRTDGEVPFAQFVLWRGPIQLAVLRASRRSPDPLEAAQRGEGTVLEYSAEVPAGTFGAGDVCIQAEGCRRADIEHAHAEDWIKTFRTIAGVSAAHATEREPRAAAITSRSSNGVRLYFGIHKHMHQPYYRTVDSGYWDGSIDGIFASRRGPYADFLVDAVERYTAGGLAHAGLSASFSGTLIEQLDRCDREGLAGGAFSGWRQRLTAASQHRTERGNPRLDFVAFGHFHPLMPLIPERDIVRQIEWHRRIVRERFATEASSILFPPETAFHVRMIPALVRAGISAVIYDSIHRFRACKDYPYAGKNEGMLPPNRAEQQNPAVHDWLQLHNIWAGSLISPSLLRPAYLRYVDADEKEHRIIGVAAERYIGNEDARGGFGALQYPSVLGQVYDHIVATGTFDPKHPPFFVLHSDGDNHGGGADSYYRHNTERLVEWLREDDRFELTTIADYLERFPPEATETIHVEPGSWSGADNGDPQFMKWFSRWDQPYSPDLNSWAVLTALQNLVHSAEDLLPGSAKLEECQRLLLMAETSCYWYWTGQEVWDAQVTLAANRVTEMLADDLAQLKRRDSDGPTIFPPWTQPSNPGGKGWGSGGLVDAPREATLYTFIDDICGIESAEVVVLGESGTKRLALQNRGAYPTRTGARRTANFYSASLPVGLGMVRYYIEAKDGRGNGCKSSVERIFLP